MEPNVITPPSVPTSCVPTAVISVPIVPSDDTYYYIAIKGSLHASDCSIFGITRDEYFAICDKFPSSSMAVEHGSIIKGHCISVINALAELGYRVISSTGEAEVVWTLQREL